MNVHKTKLEVTVFAGEDCPGVRPGLAVLQMRVKNVQDEKFDKALTLFTNASNESDYIATAFKAYANAAKEHVSVFSGGGETCSACVKSGKCEMEQHMRSLGITHPFCAAGEIFAIEELASVSVGDKVECPNCGKEFILEDDFISLDSEAEYITCPHCKDTRDIVVYF